VLEFLATRKCHERLISNRVVEREKTGIRDTAYGLIVVINGGLVRLPLLGHRLSVCLRSFRSSEARIDWAIGGSGFNIMINESFLINYSFFG